MRALVTGATGFLGGSLAKLLCARGDEVAVLVRPTSDRSRLAELPCVHLEGDVTDPAAVDRAVAEADVVFHAAARLEFGPADPTAMREVNVGGTELVLGAAAQRNTVAVHVSSVASLGPTGPDEVDETHWNPAEPLVAYERTKREAHLVARRLAGDGAPVRVAVPGGIYGPGDTSELASIIRAYTCHSIPVGYLPEIVHTVVHVEDAAEALVRIAEHGVDGGEYVVGAETVTLGEWFEIFCSAARRRPPRVYVPTSAVRRFGAVLDSLARRGVPGVAMGAEVIAMATRHLAFSGGKARRELGWEPRDLHVGMAELVEHFLTEQEATRG